VVTYSYDANGNRTMTGYQTGTGNQLLNDGTWAYTYDSEGNLIKKSKGASAETWTFGYDNQNHLVWAKDSATDGGSVLTLATYLYDPRGNRIEKDVWTSGSGTTTVTRFAYDGQNIWADLNSNSALQTRYVRGDVVDQVFARISSGGTVAHYLTDRLGSVRLLTDASGAVQDQITYNGYGGVTNETNAAFGDRWKFTGRESDSETGLQYNRARYYEPKTGRWLSIDPMDFAAGDSNLYRYVTNSPTNAIDPSGLEPQPEVRVTDRDRWETDRHPWTLKRNWEDATGPFVFHKQYLTIKFSNCSDKFLDDKIEEIYQGLKDFRWFNEGNIAKARLIEGKGDGEGRHFVAFTTNNFFKNMGQRMSSGNGPNGQVYVEVFYNDAAHMVTAVTLGNHMLVGVRKWQVLRTMGTKNIMVWTAAWERRNSWFTQKGFERIGQSETTKVWTVYLTNIGNAATDDQTLGKFTVSRVLWLEEDADDMENPYKRGLPD
jgi:RHS repeat-associated protein